ncbi:MAG: hypothetical protein QM651_15045 [Rhodoblastus sp.]
MEFSRAVLVACAAVLGFIFYAIAVLFVLLAIANSLRGNEAGAGMTTTLALAVGAFAVGAVSRLIARKLA